MEKTITAKEIHADFYGAEERLFVEAIGMTRGLFTLKPEKAARLQRIGFGKAKPIKDAEDYHKKRGVSEKLIAAIEYFRTYYPHYKFITEEEVKKLCAKYKLLLGDASNFTADMPEKNLQDIEAFKLRKEDWREKSPFGFFSYMIPQRSVNFDEFAGWQEPTRQERASDIGLLFQKTRRSGHSRAYEDYLEMYLQQKDMLSKSLGISEYVGGVDPYKKEDKKSKKEYEQPAFKICAPKEDFDTRGYEVVDGYKLIYDPIVLQPVSKDGIEGYLIVTAWGDEATDEIVVNQINN